MSEIALEAAGSPLKFTDDPAYGPMKARTLRNELMPGRMTGNENKMLGPIENADSYAWFVVVGSPVCVSRRSSMLIGIPFFRNSTSPCSVISDSRHLL